MTVSPEMPSAMLPVFVRVSVCPVLAIATGWVEKFKLLGERLALPEAVVPERLTD